MREHKFRVFGGNWNREPKKRMIYSGKITDPDFYRPEEGYIYMEYTGLNDSEGIEIYEADIVRVTGGEYWSGYYEVDIIGEVVMKYGCYGIEEKDGKFNPFILLCEPFDCEIRVLGNIYEGYKKAV